MARLCEVLLQPSDWEICKCDLNCMKLSSNSSGTTFNDALLFYFAPDLHLELERSPIYFYFNSVTIID